MNASGLPLLTIEGKNLAGVNVGSVEDGTLKSAVAIKSAAVMRYFLSRSRPFFEKRRFGLIKAVLPPQGGKRPSLK